MKKTSIALLSLLALTLLPGCGTQNVAIAKNIIPEPYTLMLKQLDSKNIDLDMTQKYADLVISDFKDTPYVYNAELIKSSINYSKMVIVEMKSKYIIAGSSKMGSLNSEDDFNKMQGYIVRLQTESKLYEPIYNETTQYLLDHFVDSDKIQLNHPSLPSGLNFNGYQSLKFFSTVGYPIPTDLEMTEDDKKSLTSMFLLSFCQGYSHDSKFSYSDYFYVLSIRTGNPIMKKELLNKIIELTKSDQYNEVRLKAQEDLSKIK